MKIALNLVILLVASAQAKPNQSNNVRTRRNNSGRIVGGVEADRNEFKFLVDISVGDFHFCGGSIISPEWVLTSALCGQSGDYYATAGDHNIDINEGPEQVRQVIDVILHPRYNVPGNLEHENDIALMKVSPPFEFNEFVQPILLPEDANFTPTAFATVTGWGLLSEFNGEPPSTLMKVDVPFVPSDVCNTAYNNSIATSMLCYGEEGKDFCLGDSGGPLICGETLCGIVSFSTGCARASHPGVYTKTSAFIDWITASTIPRDEDPSPVQVIPSCGGLIEATSAFISLQVFPSGQQCVWTVKSPYDKLRFRLVSAEVGDEIYVTSFPNGVPGSHQSVSIGQNYTVESGASLVTLFAIATDSEREIQLEIFSSGVLDRTLNYTGYTPLPYAAGDVVHPTGGGNYANNENVMFAIVPTQRGEKTLRFWDMDVEEGSGCRFDSVTVINWVDNRFVESARVCGTMPPPPITLDAGIGLIIFHTDASQTATGFRLDWS